MGIVADSISLHPNQANMANLEVPGNQVQIQIQGSDGETLEAEPPKSILKDSRRQSKVSFNEDVEKFDEIKRSPSITSDVVPRDHKGTDVSRRRSSWTQSTYSLDGGAGSTLGVLVVLKVLFVDILITGFGDAITDLLQGIYMIVEEPLNSEDTNDTIAALEQAAADKGKLYVGGEKLNDEGKQVANVKVNSELVLTCKIYGRDCSALQVWVQQPKNKEQMKKFEVECQSPVQMIKKNFKEQLDEFTNLNGYSDETHRCFQKNESTVIYSRNQNSNNCPIGVEDRANCIWGDWILPPPLQGELTALKCAGETPRGRQSFRFCRMKGEDLKNCLFMEVRT